MKDENSCLMKQSNEINNRCKGSYIVVRGANFPDADHIFPARAHISPIWEHISPVRVHIFRLRDHKSRKWVYIFPKREHISPIRLHIPQIRAHFFTAEVRISHIWTYFEGKGAYFPHDLSVKQASIRLIFRNKLKYVEICKSYIKGFHYLQQD